MTRRLISFAALCSVVACLAILLLWVRSYWVGDSCFWTTSHADYSSDMGCGRFWLAWHAAHGGGGSFFHASVRPPHAVATPDDALGELGFFFEHRRSADGGARVSLVVPLWAPAGAALLLATCPGIPALRRHLCRRSVRCVECGYDLRASKDRCPECGTPLAQRREVPS